MPDSYSRSSASVAASAVTARSALERGTVRECRRPDQIEPLHVSPGAGRRSLTGPQRR